MGQMRERLLLATNNKGKVREIKSILDDIPQEIVTIWDIKKIPENLQIEETGETFSENAELKARIVGEISGLLTLAEDSGLEIDALGGEPGVKSARFAKGSDQNRINKVLRLLKTVSSRERSARFKTSVAIYNPQTEETEIFEGETEGMITKSPQGTHGFGYDPIFFSTELNKPFGLATLREKNRVSHRARALEKAKVFLIERLQDTK